MSDPKVVDIQMRAQDMASSVFQTVGASLEDLRAGVDNTGRSLQALEKIGKLAMGMYMAADAASAFAAGVALLGNTDGQSLDEVLARIEKFKQEMSGIPVIGNVFRAGTLIGQGLYGDDGAQRIADQARLIDELTRASTSLANAQRKAWQDLNTELAKARFEMEQMRLRPGDERGILGQMGKFQFDLQQVDQTAEQRRRAEQEKVDKESADLRAAATRRMREAAQALREAENPTWRERFLEDPFEETRPKLIEQRRQELRAAQDQLQRVLANIETEKQSRLRMIDEISRAQRARIDEERNQYLDRVGKEKAAREAQELADKQALERRRAEQLRAFGLEQQARRNREEDERARNRELAGLSIAREMRLEGRPLDADVFAIRERYARALAELERTLRQLPDTDEGQEQRRTLERRRIILGQRRQEEEEDAARAWLASYMRPGLPAGRASRFLTGQAETAMERMQRESVTVLRDVTKILGEIRDRLDKPVTGQMKLIPAGF